LLLSQQFKFQHNKVLGLESVQAKPKLGLAYSYHVQIEIRWLRASV